MARKTRKQVLNLSDLSQIDADSPAQKDSLDARQILLDAGISPDKANALGEWIEANARNHAASRVALNGALTEAGCDDETLALCDDAFDRAFARACVAHGVPEAIALMEAFGQVDDDETASVDIDSMLGL